MRLESPVVQKAVLEERTAKQVGHVDAVAKPIIKQII